MKEKIPQTGDIVSLKNGQKVEYGIVDVPTKEELEEFGDIPSFIVKWDKGLREDWTYNPGDFFLMGGKIIKKKS